jgi:hypothetical protein
MSCSSIAARTSRSLKSSLTDM